MIRSCTNPDLFNGSGDMRSVALCTDESAAPLALEVVVTTRSGQGSVWSTTLLIPQSAEPEMTALRGLPMSKNSSQGRRQASTHYHDAARQHQEAAHLGKRVAPNEPRNAPKTRTSTGNRRPAAKTKR